MNICRYLKFSGSQNLRDSLWSRLSSLGSRAHFSSDAESFVEAIKQKLIKALQPQYLDVINESGGHNVPKGSASHIRVIVVSPLFNDKKLVQRHRLVNDVLQEELKTHIHALSIQFYN
ncbi:DNA-binding transcriptional regulator BolA-like [Uloborus diversus]|uniref:DNA-binding transcriptional regulator BolA-like n=1 Tax=Uloborus diversus TaxID=327109 RepID=UPI00240A67AD|nr:DNA-binding transcriptional regulator BolA-like [Uloborus diversus]